MCNRKYQLMCAFVAFCSFLEYVLAKKVSLMGTDFQV